MATTNRLLERIEFLRKKMTDIALKEGFTSHESIAISQELDGLLNLYDSIRHEARHKKTEN